MPRPGWETSTWCRTARAALVAFAVDGVVDAERAAAVLGPSPAATGWTAGVGAPPRHLASCPVSPRTRSATSTCGATRPPPTTAPVGPWPRDGPASRSFPNTTSPWCTSTTPIRTRPAAAWAGAPLHRAAVHSATPCLRVATVAGRRVELRYRYESWVRLEATRPRRRVDLGALAAELTGHEEHGARLDLRRGGCDHRGAAHRRRGAELDRAVGHRRPRVSGARCARPGPPGVGPLPHTPRRSLSVSTGAPGPVPGVWAETQARGRSQMGNHRDRSGSTGRSPARRSSGASPARCRAARWPGGAKG